MSSKPKSTTGGPTPTTFPSRISKSCTVAQLREEADARGIDLGTVSLTKAKLLEVLGEGSQSSKAAAMKTAQEASQKKKKSKTTGTAATTTASIKKKTTKTSSSKGDKQATDKEATAKKPKKEANDKKETVPAKSKSPTKQAKLPFVVAAKKPVTAKRSGQQKAPPSGSAHGSSPARKKVKTAPDAVLSSSSVVSSSAARVMTAPTVQTRIPRISKKLTVVQLKEEAKARRLESKSMPKTKADLLHHLVDGSIHVVETEEYKRYMQLLQRIEEERPRLYETSLVIQAAEEKKQEEKRQKQAAKAQTEYEAQQASMKVERGREKARQEALHTHSFPRVHPHALARTVDLKINGLDRPGRCDVCNHQQSFLDWGRDGVFSCEACDWDICAECFEVENMTPQARRRHDEKRRKESEAKRKREAREAQRQEEEEERRWNASKQFSVAIRKPPAARKTLDPANSKTKNFVVWCSDGYGNDGWHSYNPPPDKEFDTTWKTAQEANERARYLFFWQNPWGLHPQEVSDDNGDPTPSFRDGLVTYTVEPADSSCWTVGVVPVTAFDHLPEATRRRHNLDRDDISASSQPSDCLFF